MTIKCVVWDLDGTLWDDIAIEQESGTLPQPRAWVLDAIDAFAERGVLSSIASRTDPAILQLLVTQPALANRFIAPQADWQDKSVALRKISDEIGIHLDAIAFVDDSPYERAEVAATLPQVLVLAPDEITDLLNSPELNPATLTPEATTRVQRYREESQRKQAENNFTGSREDFLQWCAMQLSLRNAQSIDLPRFIELATRTHRLNTTGTVPSLTEVEQLLSAPDHWFLPVATLTDRFGDYGLIGAAIIDRSTSSWRIPLLALSCRVAGRGVALGFLRWIMDQAQAAGATELHIPVRPTGANIELRILFRQCGLRAIESLSDDNLLLLGKNLTTALPDYPQWIQLHEEQRP